MKQGWFKKLLKRTGIVILVIVLAISVGLFIWLRSTVADYNGELSVKGLSAEVSIYRDENAIPHIFAQTLEDAYAGLGFAQAQDRLWQLELMKHVSQGRLAELIGEDGLEYDSLAHALDLAKMGRVTGPRMNREAKDAIKAYVAGINAFIDGHSGAWPLEFTLLGAGPSHWSIDDVLTLSGIGMFGMSNWRDELVNARLEAKIGEKKLGEFLPPYPVDAPVTHDALPGGEDTGMAPGFSMGGWPFQAGGFSSNTWAVHGSRTFSGKPILASDPHGGLDAPIDFFLARLVGPDFDVTGVVFPGLPGFWLGTNGHIAWGLTDMNVDVTDLYIEKMTGDKTYLTPTGEQTITSRRATIRVKGQEDKVIEIRETRHGPIISDFHPEASALAERLGQGETGEHFAIAYAGDGLEHGNLMSQALIGLSMARTWQDFQAALSVYEFEHNFSFASVDNSIGLISAARVPERPTKATGLLPAPGWDGEYDWLGILAVDKMPRTLNPRKGYIFNTNNKLEPEGYPYRLGESFAPPYRALRVEELLSENDRLDMDAAQTIQLDVMSTAARHILPLLLNTTTQTGQEAAAISQLRSWDGEMSASASAPLIYTAWIRALSHAVYADELGDLYEEALDTRVQFLAQVLEEDNAWCDDVNTPEPEDCAGQLSGSLETALAELEQFYGPDITAWRWSDAHQAHFSNMIFSGVPLLSNLSESFVGVGGNTRTLNNAKSDFDEPGKFPVTFGTRYRQIIDLSDPANSRFMIAPGVSGNIFSPYYKHLVGKWANGDYFQVKGSAEELREHGVGAFTLLPIRP